MVSSGTVPCVKDDPNGARHRQASLSRAIDAADTHRTARLDERDRLDDRDRAIVNAVRAGALLSEIAEAAGITRAGVSLAARRTLPPRPGRGGPYSRRRGAGAAVRAVFGAAHDLEQAKEVSRESKERRNRAIAASVAAGAGVVATARALGMTPAAVSLIARASRETDATMTADGALASQ